MSIQAETNGSKRNGEASPPLADACKQLYEVDPSSGNLIFENAQSFQTYALEKVAGWEKTKLTPKRPCMYIYKGLVYDVSEFVQAHPGGADIMHTYNGKDVSVTFHNEYNLHAHTDKALHMMLQYHVGQVKRMASNLTGEDGEHEEYMLEELTAYPRMTETEITYKDFTIRRDRGLVWQSMFLTLPQYMHLINTPIYVPHCRLFGTAILEPFSKTPFWLIAVLWVPLSLFWTLRGIFKDYTQTNPAWGSVLDPYLYYPNRNALFYNYPSPLGPVTVQNFTISAGGEVSLADVAERQYMYAASISHFSPRWVAIVWLMGVVMWTLMEYCIHRFIFHFERAIPESIFDTPVCKWLHMLLHGIHHIIPMDPGRLVFPPALFLVASTTIYTLYSFIMTGSFLDIFAGGVVFGYVCYDEIHYLIHHTDAQDFYFKDLKKYHHAHHYVDDTRGFGISNKFWDLVFGTECRKN